MDHYFEESDFFSMPEKERIEALNNNCEEVKNSFTYSKPLTEHQIKAKNIEINQALQEIARLKEERKELSKHIREQNEIVDINNEEVIQKFTEATERIWYVINLESGYLEKINSEGYIIEKSRIKSGTTMNMFRASDQQQEVS